jgi:hypothetical protein
MLNKSSSFDRLYCMTRGVALETSQLNIECMDITGGIDGEIVSFVFMVFAEEFAVECFEEIIFIESTETKVSQADTHMNRRTIWFREECNELEMKLISCHHSNRHSPQCDCRPKVYSTLRHDHLTRMKITEVLVRSDLEQGPPSLLLEEYVDPWYPVGLD